MWNVSPMADALEIPLKGPKGEPVDFLRTIASHGVAELPPNELSLEERTLVTTLPAGGSARTVRLSSADRKLHLEVVAGRVGARARETLSATASHMFRLDEDLSAFYELVSDDPGLHWCVLGAGRMLRAPTVFEDVVKTKRTLIRTRTRECAVRLAARGRCTLRRFGLQDKGRYRSPYYRIKR
jgi:hypothetical protein